MGFWSWWLSDRGRVPCCLGGDPVGQGLVGAFVVVSLVELINQFLQLLDRVGEGLFIEPAEQGLMESFNHRVGIRKDRASRGPRGFLRIGFCRGALPEWRF